MTALQVVMRELNRPQYVPTPETLISALAWQQLEYENAELNAVGWRYMGEDNPTRRIPIRRTLDSRFLSALGPALSAHGLHHQIPDGQLAVAVSRAVAGVRPASGKGQAASPMTPGLALLQNPVGMTGAANPANYASILTSMYWFGAPDNSTNPSSLWLAAARQRVANDRLLAVLESSLADVRGPYKPKESSGQDERQARGWSATPYGWFYDSWIRLTSPAWVDALPPRVWTDWATTVLRLSLAMGYLWECERYSRFCRAAVDGRASGASALALNDSEPFELLPWPDAHLPPSARNVRSIIRRKTQDGGRLRNLLIQWEDSDEPRWWTAERFKQDVRTTLAMQGNPKYLQNLYETVAYSLLRRDASDHYGLLTARGNAIAVVEPGTEWIAVVASLAAGVPGAETHVGQVVRDLGRLGLQPRLPNLIKLLESAGLARGSADADHGVRVSSAF